MKERIRSLILEGLSGAKECPAKNDFVEELTENLLEKYEDLVSGGMEPEEAFRTVSAGIGDLDEVADFINSNPSTGEKPADNPFSTLANIFKKMARELEAPLRQMGGSVRSAFGGQEEVSRFQRMAEEMKSPLAEAGRTIKAAFVAAGDPMKDIGIGLADSARQVRDELRSRYGAERSGRESSSYDFATEAEDVQVIYVRTFSGDVEFYPSDDGKIHVVEYADKNLPEDKLASITLSDGVLNVSQGSAFAAGEVFFRVGVYDSRFEIYLPDQAWKTLRVQTVSGDVEGYTTLRADKLLVTTANGDVELKSVEVNQAELRTASGDVELEGNVREVQAESASGDMELEGVIDRSFLRTASGDLELKLATEPSALELTTVSGDVEVTMPDNAGFTLKYASVSGDLRSDFPLTTSLDRKSGTAVYGDGSLHTWAIRTTSGDVRLRRC